MIVIQIASIRPLHWPALLILCAGLNFLPAPALGTEQNKPVLDIICVNDAGDRFKYLSTGKPFLVWGVNYDHDADMRLLDDYWESEWKTVEEDFQEMSDLGANVVRVHLQVARFMESPTKMNPSAMMHLQKLIALAETTGLYLNITGLACYHPDQVPDWYDTLSEADRWKAQAFFWKSIAESGKSSPAVFCYDLMNEPIAPGGDKAESDWYLGEFAGKYFTQRIALALNGRDRNALVKDWIEHLVSAIREHDTSHMITVGVIPWAHTWPNAKPVFYSREASQSLDFVSVHFYPKANEVQKALNALNVYNIGKPLVIEEMFPLYCSIPEMNQFIQRSHTEVGVDGWFSFYWGKKPDEYREEIAPHATLIKKWLNNFKAGPPTTHIHRESKN